MQIRNLILVLIAVAVSACVSPSSSVDVEPSMRLDDSSLLAILGGTTDAFFISAEGSDSNPGTIDEPWGSFRHAFNQLKPGDTLMIRGGIYRHKLVISCSGTENAPVKIQGAPGETVVFDGKAVSITNSKWEMFRGLVDISNQKNVELSNIQINNSKYAGVMVYECENIVVKNVYTENTYSSGIGAWFCKNIDIMNNEVVQACNGGSQECISISQTDGFLVKDNIVRDGGPGDFGGEGIDAKDGSRNGAIVGNEVYNMNRVGIYVDSWATHTFNIEVYNNKVYNVSAWGMCLAAENNGLLENIRFYNNIVYNNQVGIGVEGGEWGEKGAKHPMRDIYIYNNTIVNNGMDYWGFGIHLNCSETENLYIANNLIAGNLSGQVFIEEGGLPRNIVLSANYVKGAGFSGVGITPEDLHFADQEGKEFVLITSEALRSDPAYFPDFDFYNNPRERKTFTPGAVE